MVNTAMPQSIDPGNSFLRSLHGFGRTTSTPVNIDTNTCASHYWRGLDDDAWTDHLRSLIDHALAHSQFPCPAHCEDHARINQDGKSKLAISLVVSGCVLCRSSPYKVSYYQTMLDGGDGWWELPASDGNWNRTTGRLRASSESSVEDDERYP